LAGINPAATVWLSRFRLTKRALAIIIEQSTEVAMVNVVLWIVFVILLILIVSPFDLFPGPLDDALYALFDVVIVAVLHERNKRKKVKETGKAKPEIGEGDD
jgi:hypothetical protein